MQLIKIGRSDENDIVLENDTKVSRFHAELFHDDEGRTFITDLESSNGTFVNGKKIKGTYLLKELDVIVVGKSDPIPWKDHFKNKIEIKESDRVENTEKKKQNSEIKNHKEASTGWIIAGFIFAFLGGYLGTIIGINYAFGNYDKKTKSQGIVMIIVSVIMIGIWKSMY